MLRAVRGNKTKASLSLLAYLLRYKLTFLLWWGSLPAERCPLLDCNSFLATDNLSVSSYDVLILDRWHRKPEPRIGEIYRIARRQLF